MSDSEDGTPSGAARQRAPRRPSAGMVRDPREIKTNPSLTRFLRERMTAGIIGSLVAIGVLRPSCANGELGRRSWRGLFTFLALGLRDRLRLDVGPRRAARNRRRARSPSATPGKPLESGLPHHAAVHQGVLDERRARRTTRCRRSRVRARSRTPTTRSPCSVRTVARHRQRDRALPASSRRGPPTVFRTLGTNYADHDRAAVGAELHPRSCSRSTNVVDRGDHRLGHGRERRRRVHEGEARAEGPHPPRLPAPGGHAQRLAPGGGRRRRSRRSRTRSSSSSSRRPRSSRPTSSASRRSPRPTRSRSSSAAARSSRARSCTPARRSSRTRSTSARRRSSHRVPAVHLHPGAEAARRPRGTPPRSSCRSTRTSRR